MGFANVVSGGEKGEYVVELDFGQPLVNAKLAQAAADLVKLAAKVTQAQGKYNEAKAKETAKQVLADAALEAYITAQNVPAEGITTEQIKAKSDTLQAYNKAFAELITERGKVAPLLLALDMAKSNEARLKKMQSEWQGLQLTETRTAWCADLTEDASGQVATIEVPGEDKLILIAPSAPAPSAADGVMTAREIQGPAQVFFNAAILPGWQKWKPTYRTAVITALYANDTVDLSLDDAQSSAQRLDINQTRTLKAVPVRYMDCNAAAFEVDDKVVVHFKAQDWAQPEVIGFVDNPKPCQPFEMFFSSRSTPPTDARYFARCTDNDLGVDLVENPNKYSCEYSVGGGAWMPMFYIGSPFDVWAAGGSIEVRPHLAFTKSFAMAQIPGVAVDLFANQYPGETLAFRVKKGSKKILRMAVKNSAALYAGSGGAVAGIRIANALFPMSMPLEKFEFEFPD